jgi:hypothetical protein
MDRSLPEWSRIDCVGVLDKGVIFNRYSGKESYGALPKPDSDLVVNQTNRSLLLFFSLIAHYLNQAEMPNFRFLDYIKHLSF